MTQTNGHAKIQLSDLVDDPAALAAAGIDVPPALDPAAGTATATGPQGRMTIKETAQGWADLRHTKYGLEPALVLSGIGLFTGLDNALFSIRSGIAGPEIARDLDISLTDVLFVLQVILIASVFVAIGIGWWADRHRRLPVVAIGAIISGIGGIATAGASGVGTLGTTRGVNDVAAKGSEIPGFSLMADYYAPEHRGKVFALLGFLSGSIAFFAPVLLGASVLLLGWRASFVIVAVPLIILGVWALVRLREPVRGYWERRAMGADETVALEEAPAQSFGEAWRTVWAVRTLRRFFIAMCISSGGATIYAIYYPFFLFEKYGLNAFERGLLGIPGAAGAAFGAYLGGALIDRLLKREPGQVITVITSFGVVASIGIVGAAFQPPLIVLIVFGVLVAFGSALIGPAAHVVFAQVIPPAIRTQGLQMLGLGIVPSVLITLPIGGTLQHHYGYQAAFFFAAPLIVVGALVQITAGKFYAMDIRNAQAASMAAQEWRRTKELGQAKLLVCRDVDVAYTGVQVLFGVDFDVEEGEIIALLGTNGAGKSTLLRAISGITEAASGAIVYDGRDITHMPPFEIARAGVSHVPGGKGLFPALTVRENLQLGLWMVDEELRDERLADVLELFPILRERSDAQAGTLSGGEQQQLSLASALLNHPKLLVIDELSLGLSPAVVGELIDKVKEIRDRGTTVIVVEQSVNVALTLAERAIFMEKGEVKFVGRTADLMQRPDILRAIYVKGTGGASGASASGDTAGAIRRQRELAAAPTILEVSGITKRYGGITALDDVSLTVQQGEVLGIIGPNGSGKTTLFDIISGFQPADAGTVRYNGVDITSMTADERARRKLVRRFQDARLFPSLTVYETLLVALDQRLESRSVAMNGAGLPRARKAERRIKVQADRLIDLLELGSFRDKFVKELSTGLRRIVDLACTLAAEPKLLLLDEPSSGIAQAEAEGLAPLLRRVRHETGCAILIIEHDMPLISRVSDELIALERGQVVTRGTAEAVLNDERVIQSYLGSSAEAVNRSGAIRT